MHIRKAAAGFGSQRSRLIAIGALALLALALPATARAHTGSATVSCTGADFTFVNFQSGSNTVHWVVLVDNAPAAQGDYVLNQGGGTHGAVHVPLTLYGSHAVVANAWWGPAGTVNGHTRPSNSPPLASATVDCAPAPTAPSPPALPAPAAAPPAPPSVAAATVVPAPAPAVQVEAAHATAAVRVARLEVASVCSSRVVRVAVNGTTMRDVTISVNGRSVKTIAVKPGTRSVRTTVPMARRSRALIVTARVRFRNGARERTISAPARRCSAVAVQPQFTG